MNENTRVTSAWKRQRLQVEHQLDVLVERIGHAGRRAGQLAASPLDVAGLDALDAPLDLAHVFEIALHALPVAGVEPAVEIGDLAGDVVEHAAPWRGGATARSSADPPAPNSWSNAMRGSRIIGSGSVGDAQLIMSV